MTIFHQHQPGTYRLTRRFDGPPPYQSEEFIADESGHLIFGPVIYEWSEPRGCYNMTIGPAGEGPASQIQFTSPSEDPDYPDPLFVEIDFSGWPVVVSRLGTWAPVP